MKVLSHPIIKNANSKRVLFEISKEIKDLAKLAKNKLFNYLSNILEGSITVSNLGMFGISEFAAIIKSSPSINFSSWVKLLKNLLL